MVLSGGARVLPVPPQRSSQPGALRLGNDSGRAGLARFHVTQPSASVGSGRLLCPLCLSGNALASIPVPVLVPILIQVSTLVLGSAGPTSEAKHRSPALARPGEQILTSAPPGEGPPPSLSQDGETGCGRTSQEWRLEKHRRQGRSFVRHHKDSKIS